MMGYPEAIHRCCRPWWGHADRIAEETRRRLQADYTGTQTSYHRQLVYWRDGKAILTVRVYAPWYSNGARRDRVVEFSGGGGIQYWTDYNDNDWTRVERVLAQIAEGKK